MLTLKQIDAKITSIKKRKITWNDDVQTVMVNLAAHAYVHGDVSKFGPLLSACKGADQKAIVGYVREFCFTNVTIAKGEVSVSLNKKAHKEADFADGDAVIAHLEQERKWYDAAISTEDAVRELDAMKSLESLLKRIQSSSSVKYHTRDEFEEMANKLWDAQELANSKAVDAELAAEFAAEAA